MELVKDSVFNYTYSFETEPIEIKQYFEDYSKLLDSFERCNDEKCKTSSTDDFSCGKEDCKTDKFYMKCLGISQSELNELKERTSIKHLNCENEIEPVKHEFYKKFDEEKMKAKQKKENVSSLISVKMRLDPDDRWKNEVNRTFYKYCNYQWSIICELKEKCKLDFSVSDFSNLIFCVKVYYPFSSLRSKTLKIKLLQEIHILGSHTLADLKDKILCNLDFISNSDVSNECFLENVGLTLTDKDAFPSSFIFVEDTFYNDTRPECKDLSKDLRKWAAEKGLGTFKTASMEKTKFCDLTLRLGRPFVYQHQGNCEHIIVFSDVRFATFGDLLRSASYPITYSTGRFYGKHCMMCAQVYAKWLVIGNERLTHDKTYLCSKCFFSYNYVDKTKIGKFRAYKYVDPVALLP